MVASIVAAWPTVALGEALTPISRPVRVSPTEVYPLLGMHWYAEGLYIKDRKAGTQIQADTLYQVRAGDFVYNRLFAWKGSFGVADGVVDGCYVSNEFPCFAIDETRLLPGFLRWYFAQSAVWQSVEAQSSGSTPTSRLRLKEPELLAMELPLPPLDEQRRIVARIEELAARIEEAHGLRREAMAEAEALLDAARSAVIGSIGPLWKPLRTEVESIENGHSPACEPRAAEQHEWGVLKVGAVSFGAFNLYENKVLSPTYEPDARYEVRPGDFLICRANTRELVGACAIVRATRPMLMLSDKTFRFVFRNGACISLEYLDQVLKSPVLRQQIERKATGTSPTMKNISKESVLGLLIPSHSLEEQRLIVDYLIEAQGRIDAVMQMQVDTAAELDALLPSVLDQAFRGEL